jgi:hypothetical protein
VLKKHIAAFTNCLGCRCWLAKNQTKALARWEERKAQLEASESPGREREIEEPAVMQRIYK